MQQEIQKVYLPIDREEGWAFHRPQGGPQGLFGKLGPTPYILQLIHKYFYNPYLQPLFNLLSIKNNLFLQSAIKLFAPAQASYYKQTYCNINSVSNLGWFYKTHSVSSTHYSLLECWWMTHNVTMSDMCKRGHNHIASAVPIESRHVILRIGFPKKSSLTRIVLRLKPLFISQQAFWWLKPFVLQAAADPFQPL